MKRIRLRRFTTAVTCIALAVLFWGCPTDAGDNGAGAIPEVLVGDWGFHGHEGIIPDTVILTINADGTGALMGAPATWSESGGRLTLSMAGQTGSVAWEIVGGLLYFSDAGGDLGAGLAGVQGLYRLGNGGNGANGGNGGNGGNGANGGNGGNGTQPGGTTVFDLANDGIFLSFPLHATITDEMFVGTPFRLAGATLMAVEVEGRRALHFTTGPEPWYGVRIDNSFVDFTVGDTIKIAGRVVSGAVEVHLSYNINPWGPLQDWLPLLGPGDQFEQNFTLTQRDVDNIRANAHFGHPPHLQLRSHRAGSVMVITDLVIRGNRP